MRLKREEKCPSCWVMTKDHECPSCHSLFGSFDARLGHTVLDNAKKVLRRAKLICLPRVDEVLPNHRHDPLFNKMRHRHA
jgi:hypothetical protein